MDFSLFKGSLPTPPPWEGQDGSGRFCSPSDVRGVMMMTGRYNHKRNNALLTCVTLCALCTLYQWNLPTALGGRHPQPHIAVVQPARLCYVTRPRPPARRRQCLHSNSLPTSPKTMPFQLLHSPNAHHVLY